MVRSRLRFLKAEEVCGVCVGGGPLLKAIVSEAWETLNCNNVLQLLGPLTSNKEEFLCNR